MLITTLILLVSVTVLTLISRSRSSAARAAWRAGGGLDDPNQMVHHPEPEPQPGGSRVSTADVGGFSDDQDGEAVQQWQDLEAAEAVALIERGSVRIIDVRSQMETASGLIAGAMRIPIENVPSRTDDLRGQDGPILVYCAHGIRSVYACNYLVQEGFGEVYNLKDGIVTWPQPLERPGASR